MALRTLLVDDEPPARDRLRRLLAGHSDVEVVGEAGDGLEALERIDDLAPDLVFLGIQLPEIDGLEVAASLPEHSSPHSKRTRYAPSSSPRSTIS